MVYTYINVTYLYSRVKRYSIVQAMSSAISLGSRFEINVTYVFPVNDETRVVQVVLPDRFMSQPCHRRLADAASLISLGETVRVARRHHRISRSVRMVRSAPRRSSRSRYINGGATVAFDFCYLSLKPERRVTRDNLRIRGAPRNTALTDESTRQSI